MQAAKIEPPGISDWECIDGSRRALANALDPRRDAELCHDHGAEPDDRSEADQGAPSLTATRGPPGRERQHGAGDKEDGKDSPNHRTGKGARGKDGKGGRRHDGSGQEGSAKPCGDQQVRHSARVEHLAFHRARDTREKRIAPQFGPNRGARTMPGVHDRLVREPNDSGQRPLELSTV